MPHATVHTTRHTRLHVTQHTPTGDPLALVARDSTSGIFVPASATEWDVFRAAKGVSIPTPNHLWLMQEVAGNPADSIGTGLGLRPLTATGAGNTPAYQKVIAGWSRRAIGGPGAANASLSNTSMVNTATGDFLVLTYLSSEAATGALRNIQAYGLPAIQQPLSGKTRFRLSASITDTTADHAGPVRPYVFAFSSTTGYCKMYSDLEKIVATYSASSGTNLLLQCATASDTTAANFLYCAAWDGAVVTDAQVKTLLQSLGWTIPWT